MNKVFLCVVALLGIFYLDTSAEPSCPDEDPSGYPEFFEDPDDCGAYFECSNGVALHFVCPPGTYFDTTVGCEWTENVNCGTRPTTIEASSTATSPITN